MAFRITGCIFNQIGHIFLYECGARVHLYVQSATRRKSVNGLGLLLYVMADTALAGTADRCLQRACRADRNATASSYVGGS